MTINIWNFNFFALTPPLCPRPISPASFLRCTNLYLILLFYHKHFSIRIYFAVLCLCTSYFSSSFWAESSAKRCMCWVVEKVIITANIQQNHSLRTLYYDSNNIFKWLFSISAILQSLPTFFATIHFCYFDCCVFTVCEYFLVLSLDSRSYYSYRFSFHHIEHMYAPSPSITSFSL